MTPSESAFASRDDLKVYGDNARLLFALQMRCDIDDIDSVASVAIVDGADDKGCDLVYVDRGRGLIVVAQGYESQRQREAAPANKADSLSTAAAWLFAREYDDLPERLKTVAYEVRVAIGAGEIDSVEFWYVHNVGESDNVRNSMKTVETSVRSTITDRFGRDKLPERIVATEVGPKTQDEWYEALAVHILVNENINLPVKGHFDLQGENWTAVVTAVPATWLQQQYRKYQERLFSANYREYLGVKNNRRKNEINEGIQSTASDQPGYFWVYNNGVSAIVNDFKVSKGENGTSLLEIKGLSIVNGAQTTGALGSLTKILGEQALVPIRFIRCNDAETIAEIVRYNNSQNPLVPADFKSNDSVQRRLREEFQKIPQCRYVGGRRGVERIRAQDNLIASDTCGQALAAFHGRPDIAYHQKADIWRDDAVYQNFFCVHTTSAHIVLAYSLLKAIEERKKLLREKGEQRTQQESQQFDFLSERGAIHLMTAGIAGCMEELLGRRISSLFKLSFGPKCSPAEAVKRWAPIVAALMPLSSQLSLGTKSGVKDREANKQAVSAFRDQVAALKALGAAAVFDTFAKQVAEA